VSRFVVKVVELGHGHTGAVYIDDTYGERFCEVKGGVGVDRVARAHYIVSLMNKAESDPTIR
jgi:hypothetical protein